MYGPGRRTAPYEGVANRIGPESWIVIEKGIGVMSVFVLKSSWERRTTKLG